MISVLFISVVSASSTLLEQGQFCLDGARCEAYTGETCTGLSCTDSNALCVNPGVVTSASRCVCRPGFCAVHDDKARKFVCKQLTTDANCCSKKLDNLWIATGTDGTCRVAKCGDDRQANCVDNVCTCYKGDNDCAVITDDFSKWVCRDVTTRTWPSVEYRQPANLTEVFGHGERCTDGATCEGWTGETCNTFSCNDDNALCMSLSDLPGSSWYTTGKRCQCLPGYCANYDADKSKFVCKQVSRENGKCCSRILENKAHTASRDAMCAVAKCSEERNAICEDNKCTCYQDDDCARINSKYDSWICRNKTLTNGSLPAHNALPGLLVAILASLIAFL